MEAVIRGRTPRPLVAGWAALIFALVASAGLILRHPDGLGVTAGAAVCFLGLVALTHRRLLAWRSMVALIVLVLCLIPIRRYQVASGLAFNLEIYRMLLFCVGGLWLASLLIDPHIRFRKSIMDAPFAILGLVYLASIVACGTRLNQPGLASAAIKQCFLFFSFLLLYFVITSVMRSFTDIEALLRVLVCGGAVVAFFALIEARTHQNVFNHLSTVVPFLKLTSALSASDLARGGHQRVLGSAQHPIALSALLVMLVPLAGYLAERTRQRRWWLATFLLVAAAFATLSRTGIVMLIIVFLVYLFLRPSAVVKLFHRSKIYIVPMLIVVHLALPGTLGTLHDLFFANGGLIAQQSGGQVGSGRVASFGPGLAVIGQHPILGLGYGTRIPDPDSPYVNSFITDDGWLGTGMEAGILGILAWVGIFVSFLVRLARASGRDKTARGRLLVACAASSTAFAVGMATYDALSFLQVTFCLFIVLALGSVAYRVKDAPA
jgi:hypothetical protein